VLVKEAPQSEEHVVLSPATGVASYTYLIVPFNVEPEKALVHATIAICSSHDA